MSSKTAVGPKHKPEKQATQAPDTLPLSDEEITRLIHQGIDDPLELLTLHTLPRVEEYTGSQRYAIEFVKDACLFIRELILRNKLETHGRSLLEFLFALCQERWDRIEQEVKVDEKLYNSLRSNDGWAYYFMQKKFFPSVEKMVLNNSGTVEDAKDLIMDGIYILLKNVNEGKYKVQTDARLKTYFVRICKNLWLEELKRKKKRMPSSLIFDLDAEQTEAYYYNAYLEEELNDRQRMVKEQFMKGTDTCQLILRYYYYDNLSHREIAQRMSYNSEEVSRTQKKKCFEKLRTSVMSKMRVILQQDAAKQLPKLPEEPQA